MAKLKTRAKAAAKKPAAKRAKKPAPFKSLKAAGRALKAKSKKPAKLDRATPAQKSDEQRRFDMAVAANRAGGIIVTPKGHPARPADTRWPKEIDVGKRHRKDFGNLVDLANSINDRGGLLQPIAVTSSNMLIAGERRMRAWPLTKFSNQPIPVRVIDVDSIIAGEWDENAKRKDFTPSEAAAISDEIQKQLSKLATARMKSGKKADGAAKGKAGDHAARATGFDRRTIDKARAVVTAAKENPEKFGKLQVDMDRTGKVSGPFKRLQVMQQTEALRKAPPPLPMKGPYMAMLVDFPVTGDVDKDQETIDATGRSFRGYPEMSIEECAKFARQQLLPILAPDATVWLTFPNFHIVNGSAHKIIAGFGPDFTAATMLSWEKDKIGRGNILRDQTEHAIVLHRGEPTHNALGENPPTTWLKAQRRENSRKPDELYDLIERVCPAPRFAEIFSRGGRNDKWDCHGDQAGKFAPSVAKEVQDAILKEIQLTPDQQLLRVLEAVEKGETPDLRLIHKDVGKRIDALIDGKKKFKLTATGKRELAELRAAAADAAIAATLPDDSAELQAAYLEAVSDFDAAIGERDKAAAQTIEKRLEIILRKADGHDESQWITVADDLGTRAARIVASAAAPVGQLPGWGRSGLFNLDVDGIPYVVLMFGAFDCDGFKADITIYPASATVPWLNQAAECYSGCRSITLEQALKPGADLADLCRKAIRAEFAEAKRYRDELKPSAKIFALPETWDGISEPKPAKAGKAKKDVTADAPKKVGRTLPGRDQALINFASQNGHTVSMTIDHDAGEHVATCACGQFEDRFKQIDGNSKSAVAKRVKAHKAQDAAVTEHWRAMFDQTLDQDAGLANSLASESSPTADEPAAQPDAEAGEPLLAAASGNPSTSSRAEPPAPGNASAGGSDNEMPGIPAFLDRRGEAGKLAEPAE